MSDIEQRNEGLKIKRKPKPGVALKIGQDTEALISKNLEDGSGPRTLIFESRFESGNLFLA